ncbi:hypothetical protein NLJ89_g2724 [Agrocybe chaxingu]|uniref:Uncharacterized protein n=1 Tax=Agrocybe chaxingu TaxID=84603 RepID=A0A9W8KAU0_9AGAR|nr:hypothetical protein NLJ89_g2724 [Agrocybe chaxingu]
MNDDTIDPSQELFSALSLPVLKEVVYSGDKADSLCSLLERSSCPLVQLTLTDSAGRTPTDTISLCRAAPSLESLCLPNVFPVGYFLPFLAETAISTEDHEQSILPRLRTLYVSGKCNFSWDIIPNLFPFPLESDQRFLRPLETVKFEVSGWYYDQMSEESPAKVDVLLDAGTDISVVRAGEDLIQTMRQFYADPRPGEVWEEYSNDDIEED